MALIGRLSTHTLQSGVAGCHFPPADPVEPHELPRFQVFPLRVPLPLARFGTLTFRNSDWTHRFHYCASAGDAGAYSDFLG